MKNFESADASVRQFKVFCFFKARLTGRPLLNPASGVSRFAYASSESQ